MSIDDSKEKINPVKGREGSQRPSAFNGVKQFFNETIQSEKGKDILIVFIVILVGLGSFELGRLSKESASEGLKIEYPSQNSNQEANIVSAVNNAPGKNFFASSRGSKYYPITCSAGKTIRIENRVYFTTKAEAEKAGYELSSSCK